MLPINIFRGPIYFSGVSWFGEKFEKPIVTYVNNFPGFDVGQVVPTGYNERDKGVWKA